MKFTWESDDVATINKIFKTIENTALLAYPNFSKKFCLETDASDYGMGATLYQEDKVLGYVSKKFSTSESRYTVTEKELFSIILALKFFRSFILLSEIDVYTDHANLTFDTDINASRAQRWKIALSEYDVKLHHKRGIENTAADYLSRSCLQLATQENTIQQVHDVLSHPGVNGIYQIIGKPNSEITKLKAKIKAFKNNCQTCQEYFKGNCKYAISQGHLFIETPFSVISSDIYGPIHTYEFKGKNETQHVYIITITDRCTRWTETHIVHKIDTDHVIKAFNSFIKKFGVPKTCLTDRGRQYTSEKFQIYLKEKSIKQILTSPYNPTGNSISERLNQTISRVLQIYKGEKISTIEQFLTKALNWSYQRCLGYSPYELVFLENPFDNQIKHNPDILSMAIAQNRTINNMIDSQQRSLKRNHLYKIGDKVFYREPNRDNKLGKIWSGPYIIKTVNRSGEQFNIQKDHITRTVNQKHIRPI